MLVYIPAFVLVFLASWFAEKLKKSYVETKKIGHYLGFLGCAFGVFLVLFLVAGCRYGIGIDYFFTDNTVFNGLKSGGEGFTEFLTNKLALVLINSGISHPNEAFFLIFAFFTNIFFVTTIFMNKDNEYILPTFILVFYMVFFTSMNQMRQSFGLAAGLLAFSLMYRWRKWYVNIISFILVFVGCLFHYSTILCIVPLIIYLIIRKWNDKISSKILFVIISFFIALAPIGFITLKYTIEYIPVFSKYKYFFDPNFDQSAAPFVKFLASIAMFIVPLVNFIYCLLHFEKTDDHMIKMIITISGINVFLMVFGVLMNSIIFADRLKTLFYMLEIFFIPYMFKKLPKGNVRMTYLTLTCGVMLIWTIATLPTSLLYPYRSIFFKDIFIY